MKQITLLTLIVFLASCTRTNPQTGGESSALGPSPVPATYTPRVGVAVSTGSRTCLAIRNSTLVSGSPVTLISPTLPQTFMQAEIGGPSQTACPITRDVDTTVSNYDIHVTQGPVQKLTPLIAVVGASTPFSMNNNNVQADLDQNGKTETFRECSGNDGIHLSVWSGNALTGTVLWHGYYYEPGNPGVGPACTAKETTGP